MSCALALAAAFLAAPSWAQEPPAPPSPAPYAAPTPAPPRASMLAATTASDAGPVLQLTLEEAVKRAMDNNVDIAVQRYSPQDSELAIKQAKGAYDPLLTSTLSKNSQTDPARNAFSGGEKVDTDTSIFNFGAFQYIPTGGNLRLDFNNNKTDTNSVFTTFNPSFGSSLNANLAQPLLRDFKIDFNRRQIIVAKKNREISDVEFRQTVVNTLANVKNLYYDLLYSMDNLEVQRKSLALADRFLEENQIKVRVGTLAPLDVVAAESEKASREEAVILAEAAVLDAEDAMKRAIFPDNNPATWESKIVPVDRPTAEPVVVDLPAAINRALAGRTDVVSARKSLEVDDINVKFTHNQTLPVFDLVAGYGATGVGGTLLQRDGLGGPVIARSRAATAMRSPACSATTSPPGPWASTSRTRSSTARRRRPTPAPGSAATSPWPACSAWRCRSRPRSGPPPARSRRTSSAWRPPAPPASSRSGDWTPRPRSSRPACPRTSW
jgi:outer membrane protein TolC